MTEARGVGTNGGDPVLLLLLTAGIEHVLHVVVRLCVRENEVSVNGTTA